MATDGVRPLQAAAALFESLADDTRLWLLLLLSEGEARVGTLCARTRRPQPTVSHHLAILRRAGLVLHKRDGKSVIYRLAEPSAGDGALRVSRDGLTVTVSSVADKGRH